MRHDKHCAVIVHQKVLQPDDASQIEIVRRLVEQDDVRMAEQRLRQQNLHFQARIHIGHQRLVIVRRDAQPLQNAGRIGLRLPAAELGKFLLQFGGAHAVLIRHLLLGIDRVLLLAAVVQPLVAHDDGVHHRVGVIHRLILLKDGHSGLWVNIDVAGGRLQHIGENFQKRGFSGAVRADDTIAVTRGKLQIYLGKQGRAAILQRQVFNRDQFGNLLSERMT